MTSVETLRAFLETLPRDHPDRLGVARSIEVLESQHRSLHLITRIQQRPNQAWPGTLYEAVCACGERFVGEGTFGAQRAWDAHLRETEKA